MQFAEFHNALRILMNIDQPEFDATLDPIDRENEPRGWEDRQWVKFRDNPHVYFIKCCDTQARNLFAIIQERNSRHARPGT